MKPKPAGGVGFNDDNHDEKKWADIVLLSP